MKNKLIVLFSAIFLFAGCTTFAPEKVTPDDCLVVIKTTFENPKKHPILRNYYLNFSNIYDKKMISKKKEDYMLIVIDNDQTTIESVYTKIIGGNTTGNTTGWDVDIPLPYKPGELVVADFCFIQTITKNGPNSYTTDGDFYILDKEERDQILTSYSNMEEFQDWFN